jgi:hypothetical protein
MINKKQILQQEQKNKSNKIFGIGMPKTGTVSLDIALKRLDYVSLHNPHPFRLAWILNIPMKHWDKRLSDFNGCEKRPEYRHILDLFLKKAFMEESISFKSWDAITNFGEHFYPALDKNFPNSKFILTIRDKKTWIKSIKNHLNYSNAFHAFKEDTNFLRIFTHMSIFNCYYFDEDHFSTLYDNHLRNVKYYFKDREQDLLIIDICGGEGWERLCQFLGKEVPDVPFPHENKTQ